MPPSRRDDLIEAAMRVFGRSGFHHTGIDKILREGGISRMTLYNHFASKDELIVAALRRRDEIFRNRMMKFVEARDDPIDRLFAVFDFHDEWFAAEEFCGCMFINASAEFGDSGCAVRAVAAEHKATLLRYLRTLCTQASVDDPAALAEQIGVLLDGAIVAAHVLGAAGRRGTTPVEAARPARRAAEILIDAARV